MSTSRLACEPLQHYVALTKKLFAPFGAEPSEAIMGPCKKLRNEESSILSNLSAQVWGCSNSALFLKSYSNTVSFSSGLREGEKS